MLSLNRIKSYLELRKQLEHINARKISKKTKFNEYQEEKSQIEVLINYKSKLCIKRTAGVQEQLLEEYYSFKVLRLEQTT